MDILTELQADGVTVSLTDRGTVRASGPEAVVARWLPVIREQRATIITALQSRVQNPLRPGDRVRWERFDGVHEGTIDFVHLAADGITWAFTAGPAWSAVNCRFVSKVPE